MTGSASSTACNHGENGTGTSCRIVTPGDLPGTIRRFETGATRNSDRGKYEIARFLDPLVIREFCAYMHKHRQLTDGSLRDPDNWKKGLSKQSLIDGLARHWQDIWEIHEYGGTARPESGERVDESDALCAIMFNTMALLHRLIQQRRGQADGWPE